jgi:large subunit ribosomal protein L15e
MAKSFYRQVAQIWKKPKESLGETLKSREIKWRQEPTVVRIEKPTRINRARSVGYKAKLGFSLARVKIGKGGRRRKYYGRRGRKPSKMGLVHFSHGKSLQKIAEEKAQRKFSNINIIGSYEVAEDGKQMWFEVVMVDPQHSNISKKPKMKWAAHPANRNRVLH